MNFDLQQLHFIFIPFMAPGHSIPMINIAKAVAKYGVSVTIFTTPLNGNRFKSVFARAEEARLCIKVIHLQIPLEEVGLNQEWQSVDLLPSMDLVSKFIEATSMMQPSIEQFFKKLKPSPSCIVSDMCLPWTDKIAQKFHIPRIIFHGFDCFSLLCIHYLNISQVFDNLTSDSEEFTVPNLPDRIELTKAQVAVSGLVKPNMPGWNEIYKQMMEAEDKAFGLVMNTFEELEPYYINEYKKAKDKRVWCIGPVSLLNKAEKGNKNSLNTDQNHILKWLDSFEPNSVIYACLGSLSRLAASHLIELGLALESSKRPFIWVMREISDEFKRWLLEEKFEERTKCKGLMIHEWAPQVSILSHPSIGGFLTHCGWNSTLEAICSGVPMITFPLFSEQFINEKLVINILKIGVKAGVKVPVPFGYEENVGMLVNKDDIMIAIETLMKEEDEEGESRRKRAKQVSNFARKAVDEGGSSQENLAKLIQDIVEEVKLGNQSKIVS